MFVCVSQNIVSHVQEGAILCFVFEIRLAETIEYIEFICRYGISDWYAPREAFTVFML